MANFSKVKIYVQPYVAKYLAVHSQLIKFDKRSKPLFPKGALYFNNRNVVGKLLIRLLEKADLARAHKHGVRTEAVVLAIADQQWPHVNSKRHPVGISNESCEYVNQVIKELMWAQLYYKVKADRENGRKMIASINEFYAFFDITEDDLSFEARKKGFYRYSKIIESSSLEEL